MTPIQTQISVDAECIHSKTTHYDNDLSDLSAMDFSSRSLPQLGSERIDAGQGSRVADNAYVGSASGGALFGRRDFRKPDQPQLSLEQSS
ncbi:hypothetical protein [Pelagicoccus sp. SDUM812005]|uniref:hypothetical protein n=1 Tax=Pelagicoccus sp. SDUM812005 TaxID=3041257 RepID=UPI00280FBBD8|nr:hypothetical protein [Pelagicoccus sp. SDUM812005]MDQ8181681.1 hypothetical protein [Pelagicoccus sp. SDUM812005]